MKFSALKHDANHLAEIAGVACAEAMFWRRAAGLGWLLAAFFLLLMLIIWR